MEVTLHYIVLIWIEVLQVACQKDATTLCCCLRLRYERLPTELPSFLCLITKLLFEFTELCWQEPRLREEFIIFRVQLLHALKVTSEMILSS